MQNSFVTKLILFLNVKNYHFLTYSCVCSDTEGYFSRKSYLILIYPIPTSVWLLLSCLEQLFWNFKIKATKTPKQSRKNQWRKLGGGAQILLKLYFS
jgi:hypothetical protein